MILSRLEVGIESRPPGAGLHIVLVVTFKLVAVLYLLRRDVTQSGIVKFQFSFARTHDGVGGDFQFPAIGEHHVNINRRGHQVGCDVRRVNHRDTLSRRKPDSPVQGLAAGRLLLISFKGLYGVEPVVGHALQVIGLAIRKIVQTLPADPEKAPPGRHPQRPVIVGNNAVDDVIEQAVLPADVSDLPILDPGHARFQSRPHNAVPVFANTDCLGVRKSLVLRPECGSSIFDLTDSVTARDPDGAIARGDHVEDPAHRRPLVVREGVGCEIVGADPVKVACSYNDALGILGHRRWPDHIWIPRHNISVREYLDVHRTVDQVNIAVLCLEYLLDVRIFQSSVGGVGMPLAVKVVYASARCHPESPIVRGRY